MKSLIEEIQTAKKNLTEFAELTQRILVHIGNVVTVEKEIRHFSIYSSSSAGTTKYTRPVNQNLFLSESHHFQQCFERFLDTLHDARTGKREFTEADYINIDSVTYTMQQSIGIALDFLANPNSARKHVGNRFEELIGLIVSELGVANKKVVLKIPYSEHKKDIYSCETDLVFSPFPQVKSNSGFLHPQEVVLSLKTSSKDRMGKIFIDKLLMQKFVGHDVKVVGIFLNDVQRMKTENISFTFVSGLFMVYTKFLAQAEGMYFVDMPPATLKAPHNHFVFPFSRFVLENIWKLIGKV